MSRDPSLTFLASYHIFKNRIQDPIKYRKKAPSNAFDFSTFLFWKNTYTTVIESSFTHHRNTPIIIKIKIRLFWIRYFLNVYVWIVLREMRRRKKTLVVVVIRRLLTCAIVIIALLGFLTVHIYVAPLNRLPRLHLNKHTTRVRNQSLFSKEDFDIFKRLIRFSKLTRFQDLIICYAARRD